MSRFGSPTNLPPDAVRAIAEAIAKRSNLSVDDVVSALTEMTGGGAGLGAFGGGLFGARPMLPPGATSALPMAAAPAPVPQPAIGPAVTTTSGQTFGPNG